MHSGFLRHDARFAARGAERQDPHSDRHCRQHLRAVHRQRRLHAETFGSSRLQTSASSRTHRRRMRPRSAGADRAEGGHPSLGRTRFGDARATPMMSSALSDLPDTNADDAGFLSDLASVPEALNSAGSVTNRPRAPFKEKQRNGRRSAVRCEKWRNSVESGASVRHRAASSWKCWRPEPRRLSSGRLRRAVASPTSKTPSRRQHFLWSRARVGGILLDTTLGGPGRPIILAIYRCTRRGATAANRSTTSSRPGWREAIPTLRSLIIQPVFRSPAGSPLERFAEQGAGDRRS